MLQKDAHQEKQRITAIIETFIVSLVLLIMVYESFIVNCCSNYAEEEGTTVRKRPNEKMDKVR